MMDLEIITNELMQLSGFSTVIRRAQGKNRFD